MSKMITAANILSNMDKYRNEKKQKLLNDALKFIDIASQNGYTRYNLHSWLVTKYDKQVLGPFYNYNPTQEDVDMLTEALKDRGFGVSSGSMRVKSNDPFYNATRKIDFVVVYIDYKEE